MKQLHLFVTLSITLLASLHASAQHPAGINGIVTSASGPLESVSVSLYTSDSTLVKMNMSDQTGKYFFNNIPEGKYYLLASRSGYNPAASNVFEVQKDLPVNYNLHLKVNPGLLAGITVQSKKQALEMKADKLVMNVDASPSNAGNTALEVLEKAPGVTIDKDGNISLKGKQGVTVLIDGKQTHLSSGELADMLKGMTASQLDQVEIMSNPSARFDAEGSAGIINLKLKKQKIKGFNGSITSSYGQGKYAKAGTSAQLNFRKDKLNVFGSVGYNYRKGFQDLVVTRKLYNEAKSLLTSIAQKGYMPEHRKTLNARIGADYDFTTNTSGSITLQSVTSEMQYDNNIHSRIFDESNTFISSNEGHTLMTPDIHNYSASTTLRTKLDTSGSEITFNGMYINYTDAHTQKFHNAFYDKDGSLSSTPDTLNGYLPTGYKVYAFKADVLVPAADESAFEAGVKASFVESDNNIRFDSIINGKAVNDINRTNHYVYSENIYAGYLNYSMPVNKRFKIQTGIRYEYTKGTGRSISKNESFQNKYYQFFPTLFLSYELDNHNQLHFNYGKRISRPQYKDMNPFVFILDRYTFLRGNPNLKPQFTNSLEVSHMFRKTLTTTINYSLTKGAISEVIESNPVTKEATLIKKNIATREMVGIAFNLNKPLNSWLTVTGNANLYHNQFKGIVNDSSINFKANTGNFYAAIQFKFKKGWDAEVNGFLNSKAIDGVSYDDAMGMISLTGSKTVLNDKGKVTLNVRDPFKWLKYDSRTNFGTVDARIISRWDNQIATLTLNYRFGKQFKTNKKTENSASEEQGRIGG